jgi:hypothetical protein
MILVKLGLFCQTLGKPLFEALERTLAQKAAARARGLISSNLPASREERFLSAVRRW